MRENKIKECWEIYEQIEGLKIAKDDIFLGNMIRLCQKSHQAEKAIQLWKELLQLPDTILTSLHYNSIIHALSSRKEYCEEALELYD